MLNYSINAKSLKRLKLFTKLLFINNNNMILQGHKDKKGTAKAHYKKKFKGKGGKKSHKKGKHHHSKHHDSHKGDAFKRGKKGVSIQKYLLFI